MKIINGKIVECTDAELQNYFNERELELCGFTYEQFKSGCKANGTVILEKNNG